MAVAVDASSPAIATNTTSANLTCAAFNPPACLLVACIGADGTGNMTATVTNNGTALTWTNRSERDLGDAGAQSGHASIYTAELTAGRTGMTVTLQVTGTGAGAKALKVYCVTGYDTSDPIGNTPGEGSSTTNSITPTIISAAESANSLLFVAANEFNQLGVPTSSDLTIDTYNISGAASGLFGRKAGPTSAGGAATGNLDAAGTAAAAWNWASIEVEPAASGTTFTQNVSGGITLAGALARQASKPLAGGVTTAGAVTKLTAKAFAGAVTPAGALAVVKAVLRAFAGGITPTGAMIRQPGKQLGGSITPAGVAARATGKRLAGTVTPAGSLGLIRAILRSFVGAVTPTGALLRTPQKSLGGAVTPSGVLLRRPAKNLAGAVAPSGALAVVKAVLRSFGGAITPAGTVTRRIGKVVGGAIAPAGSVRRLVGKALAGTIAAAGGLLKQTGKRFTGSVAPAGAVATQASSQASVVHRPNTGTAGRPDSGRVIRPYTGTVDRP
jgi:hypothetical protein